MSTNKKSLEINDFITTKTFEWIWRGSVKDMFSYGVNSPDKLLYKSPLEVSGIFLNKLKLRMREAFGNLNYLGSIKTKHFRVDYKVDERLIKPVFEMSGVKFIQEEVTEREQFAWYLRYEGNFFPLTMCANQPLRTVREFLEQYQVNPAIEILEEETVKRAEDWGDDELENGGIY